MQGLVRILGSSGANQSLPQDLPVKTNRRVAQAGMLLRKSKVNANHSQRASLNVLLRAGWKEELTGVVVGLIDARVTDGAEGSSDRFDLLPGY